MFIDTILDAFPRKHKFFSTKQETARKDIELAIRVLLSMLHILVTPSRLSYIDDMKRIMKCKIVLHNMVIEELCFILCEAIEEIADGVIVGHSDQQCRTALSSGTVQ